MLYLLVHSDSFHEKGAVLWTGHKDREWTTRGSGGWSTVCHRWRSVSTPDLCIFVVDGVTLGQVFVRVHRFPPISNIPQSHHCYILIRLYSFFLRGSTGPVGLGLVLSRFRVHNRPTTLGRTPADEWSGRRTDLYLTTHNTHKRLICMPSAGFEPTVTGSERIQTHALDRADTEAASSSIIDALYTEQFTASLNNRRKR